MGKQAKPNAGASDSNPKRSSGPNYSDPGRSGVSTASVTQKEARPDKRNHPENTVPDDGLVRKEQKKGSTANPEKENPEQMPDVIQAKAQQEARAAAERTPTVPAAALDAAPSVKDPFPEPFNLFEPLPLPFNPVMMQNKGKNPEKINNNKDQVKETRVVKENPLYWTADLSGTYYTGVGEAKPWALAIGVAANYRLNATWAVSLGATVRIVPDRRNVYASNSDTMNAITQLRYGFGYEKTEYILESSHLRMLELPIGLHWNKGPIGLEAGLTPGFLTAAGGKTVKETSSSLHPTPESSVFNRGVKVNNDIYRKAYFSLYAGAEWQATRRLGLVAKFGYRPSGVLKNYSDLSGPKTSLFWIDAGFRIRF